MLQSLFAAASQVELRAMHGELNDAPRERATLGHKLTGERDNKDGGADLRLGAFDELTLGAGGGARG